MKKSTLLAVVAFLITLSPLAASASEKSTTAHRYYNGYGDSFTFVERGITFSVFPNGEFDFYINPNGRTQLFAGVDFGAVSISFNSGYNYDAYVQYDDFGAIVQIEDIPIYYDYYGRVSQAGNVRIRYNANRISRVGGLYVHYDRFGFYSHSTGFINRWNRRYVYNTYHDYFVRPAYTRCIVSYEPYRRTYKPRRYDYYRGRGFARGYKYRSTRPANRSFRSVASRVRTNNDSRRITRNRSVNTRNRVATTNTRRVTTRNRSVTKGSRNNGVKRSVITRNRNTVVNRSTQGVRRNTTKQRRTPSTVNRSTQVRRTTTPRANASRSTVKPTTPNRTVQGRTVERRTTPRITQRSTRTVKRARTPQLRTQTRKAPQRRIAQNRTTTRNQNASRTTQRNVSRRSSSRRVQ